nr:zinc finger, CCHC-type [Tanacetum cinerariifolium]
MAAFNVLETQFQMFITSRVYLNDEYVAMTRSYFIQYTQQAILEFRDTLIQHLESVKKSIDERVQLKREYDRWVNERQMQTTEEKDTSSRSGNDAHDDGADIRPIYDEEPMAKEAKKKTQERSRNSEPSLMPSARSQSIANGSKPKPMSNTQTSRNWHASKRSFAMTKTIPLAEHPRNSRNDSCVTQFLNKVNSRAKVPYNKTTNRNKPVEQISVPNKPERQIPTGHRFSIQKTSIVQKKTMTPRSCLRWKPTDITNQYECEQTLDVSAELRIHDHSNELSSSKLVPKVVPSADKTDTSRQELELLFHHHITMLRYDGDECDKGKTPTKIELTMEQSEQGVINDVLKDGNYLIHSYRVVYFETFWEKQSIHHCCIPCPMALCQRGVQWLHLQLGSTLESWPCTDNVLPIPDMELGDIVKKILELGTQGVEYGAEELRSRTPINHHTLLYGRESLTVEDVPATLNLRELKKRTEVTKKETGDGLYVRGRSDHSNGHLKRDCPIKKSSGFAKKGNAYFGEALVIVGNDNMTKLVIDSGGSYHMTHRRDFLYDFKVVDGGSGQLGDNRTCTIKGTGKVKTQLHDGSSFILEDVRYVPGLRRSLILLGTLKKEGYTVKMQMGRIKVRNDDAAVAQTRLEDKQLEEKTNADCLVHEQEKVHFGIKVGENITVTGVPGQEGAEGNVVKKKNLKESMEANLEKLLKYNAWSTRWSPIRGSRTRKRC